jgi:hypothetical protein
VRGPLSAANVTSDNRLDGLDAGILGRIASEADRALTKLLHAGRGFPEYEAVPDPDAVFQKIELDGFGHLKTSNLSMAELASLDTGLGFISYATKLAVALELKNAMPAELGGALKQWLGLPRDAKSTSLKELIALVSRADFGKLASAGAPLIVGTDIDSTIVGQETYVGFIAHLSRSDFFQPEHLPLFKKLLEEQGLPVSGDPNVDAMTLATNINNNTERKVPIPAGFDLLLKTTQGSTPEDLLASARDYVKNGLDADGNKLRDTYLAHRTN